MNDGSKKNAYIVSHSHWDREWYMPFEYHRARLVELIDTCMELFEKDKNFKCFYLDGHTALIEDYLEIKPKNRNKIEKYIKEGRFIAGPWYVLQDEFLTSGESQVRNINIGIGLAKEFGAVCRVGYFPDSFGNAGQIPQLMEQAGMVGIAFGRGVKPTGMNNSVSDGGDYASKFSELYWESPNGSKMLSVLFANWYNNGVELPDDGNKQFWDEKLDNVEKYASTDELLFMNGCDHQPVQTDLSKALDAARKNYPDINFIHSDIESYIKAISAKVPENLAVIRGELTNQFGDGWWTLANTASSHMEIKRMNKICENKLVSTAEPLCVIASELGGKYPYEMLEYSWKTLLKNHAHDSICGCSVDAVHEEMKTRFEKSRQAAETIVDRALKYISRHIDKTNFENCDAVFAVINTYGKERSDVVCAKVDVSRVYTTPDKFAKTAEEIESTFCKDGYALVDENGTFVPCSIKPSFRFGYDLPNDKFRQPYMAKTLTVEFESGKIPQFGYKTFGIVRNKPNYTETTLVTGKNTMENDYVKAEINSDGTLNLFDKINKRSFDGLLMFEDVGDIGNEYAFFGVKDDKAITSKGKQAKIELIKDEAYAAEYKITVCMYIPVSGDKQLSRERETFEGYLSRTAGRSGEKTELVLESFVSLTKNSPEIKVRTEFKNTARDHRLRVIVPTNIKCSKHKAESIFDVVERDNRHGKQWKNPCGCERQQGFVLLKDTDSGIAVSNIGMHEYEILENNEIALTMLRAVGEMGDWGVFPTEGSQCLSDMVCEYSIIPFGDENSVYDICAAKQYPISSVQLFDTDDKNFVNNEFDWKGEGVVMTSLKKSPITGDTIMRWVNYSDSSAELTVRKTNTVNNLYLSNIAEEIKESVQEDGGSFKVRLCPHEILTLGIKNNKMSKKG